MSKFIHSDDEYTYGCHNCIWGRYRYAPFGAGFYCEMPDRPTNGNGMNARRMIQAINRERNTCNFNK